MILEGRLQTTAANAVRQWGAEKQLRQLSEECGELVAAVNQRERGRATNHQLASEVADVLIMAMQARHIIGAELVDLLLADKLNRLEFRLADEMAQVQP